MTNREILKRLKDCVVRENVTYFTDGSAQGVQTVGTIELSHPFYEWLIHDLEKDALREEVLEQTRKGIYKIAKASTYGKYSYDGFIRVDSGDWKELYEQSLSDRFKISNYFTKHYIINDGKITKNVCAVVRNVDYPTPKVMFNGPCTIFQWEDFKTVVKCDEEDEFDVDIGLGIALYRYYRQNADTRKQFNKLGEYMFLLQLADYALDYFCDFSKKKRNGLFNNEPVNGWYILDK